MYKIDQETINQLLSLYSEGKFPDIKLGAVNDIVNKLTRLEESKEEELQEKLNIANFRIDGYELELTKKKKRAYKKKK